jgi:hypothetical protein
VISALKLKRLKLKQAITILGREIQGLRTAIATVMEDLSEREAPIDLLSLSVVALVGNGDAH